MHARGDAAVQLGNETQCQPVVTASAAPEQAN
jgi:hypothetical protein